MKPENPHKCECTDSYCLCHVSQRTQRRAWQEGADTIEDYWFSPCTEHQIKGVADLEKYHDYKPYYPKCRFLCPECRKEAGR